MERKTDSFFDLMMKSGGIKKEKGEDGSGNRREVEESETSKKRKKKEITIPEFKITITNTYLFNLASLS